MIPEWVELISEKAMSRDLHLPFALDQCKTTLSKYMGFIVPTLPFHTSPRLEYHLG